MGPSFSLDLIPFQPSRPFQEGTASQHSKTFATSPSILHLPYTNCTHLQHPLCHLTCAPDCQDGTTTHCCPHGQRQPEKGGNEAESGDTSQSHPSPNSSQSPSPRSPAGFMLTPTACSMDDAGSHGSVEVKT